MARLKRITNKIFGSTASPAGDESVGAYIGQFGSAKIGTYNGTGDVEEIQALPAWDNGWIDAVIPNQQYPTLPEMTGVGKVLSYQTGYVMQEGICEWDSGTEYCKNSIVKYVPETITYSASVDIGASTGITGASVDVDTFTTQITIDGDYAFTFDGSVWQYEGITTNLTLYGITYTGTPATDDVITITLTSTIYRGDGTLYISLTDENINNNPSTDSVNWLLYSSGVNKDLSNLSPTGQAVIDSKVNKSGDTMTGNLVIENSDIPFVSLVNTSLSLDELPEATKYSYIRMADPNDTLVGSLYLRYGTDGNISTRIGCINRNHTDSVVLAIGFDANGNEYFSFPKCATKPTTTSSAASNKVAVVVENYVNGNSWYRKWSDGFIEQGGYMSNVSDGQVIQLLKNYTTANYSISITTFATSTSAAFPVMYKTSTKTTSSFAILKRESATEGIMWQAYGY